MGHAGQLHKVYFFPDEGDFSIVSSQGSKVRCSKTRTRAWRKQFEISMEKGILFNALCFYAISVHNNNT